MWVSKWNVLMTKFKSLLTVREVSSPYLRPSKVYFLDGRQSKAAAQETSLVIQHVANDIDQIKCS